MPAPAQVAAVAEDLIVARADLSDVRLAAVRERLAQIPPTEQRETGIVQALLAAAQDQLIVREMAVLHETPQPGETAAQAADRFLAGVWRADPNCAVDLRDVKWAYLRDLGKYKHPTSFTVWDAQFQCCPDVEQCPLMQDEACRKQVRPQAEALAQSLRKGFAALPPIGLAAQATDVALESTPLKLRHIPAFEEAVAATREARLKLRRYTYFKQGEKGFEGAKFQPGEPRIEAVVDKARLGDVLGPIDTAWGIDVVLLVAREPARSGLLDPAVAAEVRGKACAEQAQLARVDYRQRLLAGSRLEWRKDAIARAFGREVLARLPPDATAREAPSMPAGL